VAKRAFNAAVMAAGVSMLVAIALRVAYGAAAATMVPVWFAWVLLVQAWASRRSIEHNAALYTAAEANELERSERAATGVRVSLDERDEQRADVGEDTRDRAAMEAKKVCA
jgi:hypothetical protein